MSPEEYAGNYKLLVIELKSELRIAQVRIETQKELIDDKSAQIDKLLSIVGQGIRSGSEIKVEPIINVSPSITQSAQNTQLPQEFSKLVERHADIKAELELLYSKASITSPTEIHIEEIKALILSMEDKTPGICEDLFDIAKGVAGSVWGSAIIEALKLIS